MFTSPFFRCCQTAWPLASRLSATVTCHPDVHENGGVHAVIELEDGRLAFDESPFYTASTLGEGELKGRAGTDSRGHIGERGHPGKCMSAADIEARFPGYGTAMLPREGQWYAHGGETPAQSAERARHVATWLKHDRDLHEDIGDGVMVLVIHGAFIDSLLKALLLGPDATASSIEEVAFQFPNTGTASPRYCTCSCAAECGSSARRSLAQYQVCRYAEYAAIAHCTATANVCHGVAATALLNINEDGRVAVAWVGRVDHLQNAGAHERARL